MIALTVFESRPSREVSTVNRIAWPRHLELIPSDTINIRQYSRMTVFRLSGSGKFNLPDAIIFLKNCTIISSYQKIIYTDNLVFENEGFILVLLPAKRLEESSQGKSKHKFKKSNRLPK